MTRLVVAVMVMLFVNVAAIPSADAGDAGDARRQIVGTWRGTSSCVRADGAACDDEDVLYEISPADSETVLLRADKIASGQRAHMYDATFRYDAVRDRWTSELRSARLSAVWTYTVNGDALHGTLQDTKTRELLRRVEAKRQR